ncbi:MAG: hypothetical protein WCJ26_12865 [bacterium]
MAGKKVFMLRVLPEMYESLEKWAADEFRSVNGQLEWAIEKALKEAGRMPKKVSPPSNDNPVQTNNADV